MNMISQLFQHRNLSLIPAGLRLIGNVCYYSSKAQGTCWNLSTEASVIEQVAAAQNQFILAATEIHHKWIFQLLKKNKVIREHQFCNRFNVLFYLNSSCVSVLEWRTGLATFPTHICCVQRWVPAMDARWQYPPSDKRRLCNNKATMQCKMVPALPTLSWGKLSDTPVSEMEFATSKQTSLVSQSAGQVELFFCCLAVHKNKNKNSFFFFDFL